MNEKEFLITMAVRKYNEQYARSIDPSQCDIRSIPTRQSYDRSYEIRTNRTDDYVKLNVHLNFGDFDHLYPYRLETEGSGLGDLTDEVFVTTGTIDRYYQEQNVYKFQTLQYNDQLQLSLLLEDSTPLLAEDGTNILLE